MVTPRNTLTQNKDAAGTAASPATPEVVDLQARIAKLEESASQLDTDLASERLKRDAEKSTHETEVARMEQTIQALQSQIHLRGSHRTMTLNTPENCLTAIIDHLQAVAVGGAAGVLRQTVHDVAKSLDKDGKERLKEFSSRLRSAAEAVDQEASTLLI